MADGLYETELQFETFRSEMGRRAELTENGEFCADSTVEIASDLSPGEDVT